MIINTQQIKIFDSKPDKNKKEEEKAEKNFKLKPEHLSNDKFIKNFYFVVCSYTKEVLFSITTVFVENNDFSKTKDKTFTFKKKGNLNELKDIVEEMKKTLKDGMNKGVSLCINPDDRQYIIDELKKQSVEVPKFFEKNILLLNAKDFSSSKPQEIIETFKNNTKKFSSSEIIN